MQRKLTKKEVLHIAKLANLHLTPKELVKFQKQLSDILDYVSQVNKALAKETPVVANVIGLKNIFRDDKVRPCQSQKEAIRNSPSVHNGFFKVKPVFE